MKQIEILFLVKYKKDNNYAGTAYYWKENIKTFIGKTKKIRSQIR